MNVRKRGWSLLILVGVIAVISGWVALKRRVPIAWLSDPPVGEFVFFNDLSAKPFIDWKLPIVGTVRYPKSKEIIGEKPDPRLFCGIWDLPAIGNDARIRPVDSQKAVFPLPLYREPGEEIADSFTAGSLLALPYATAPSFRDSILEIDDKVLRIRLPVTHRYGPPPPPSISEHGPYRIRLELDPWPYTTSPVSYSLHADAPKE